MENTEAQQCAAFLRSRYLQFISSLSAGNFNCEIRMYDNTTVTGVVKGFDMNFENLIVDDLKTPFANSAKTALLRITDIISIEVERNLDLLKIQ